MAITPQIDNQLNTITSIEQIPSKTYKLNDDILATKKEYLEPTIVESYESITIDDLGDPNIKLEAAGNSTQEIIEAVAGKTVTGFDLDITDADLTKENQLIPEGHSEQETTEGNQLVDFSNMDKSSNTTVTFVNDVLTVSSTGTSKNANQDITTLVKNNAGKTLKFVYDSIDITNQYGTNIAYLSITNDGVSSVERLLSHSLANTPYTIPSDTSNITSVIFRVVSNGYSSTSYDASVTITKPMLQFGTEDKQYEEYTGGQASPNPSYEQRVNSVGDNVNYLPIDVVSETINGVTVTRLNDGTFKLNGTTTENTFLILYNGEDVTLPAGTYTGSIGNRTNIIDGYIRLGEYGAYKTIFDNTHDTNTFTIDEPFTFNRFYIYINNNKTFNNQIIKPELSLGTLVKPYAPHNSYNIGSISIEKCNKNWFEEEYLPTTSSASVNARLKAGTYTLSTTDNSSFEYNLYIKLLKNGTTITDGGHLVSEQISNYSSTSYNYYGGSNKTFATFTIDDDYDLIIRVNGNVQKKVVLVKGNSPDRVYIAHQSQTYPIYTQAPMRAIGDVRDDFVKQADVWYERHKIGNMVLNGTENWTYNGNSSRPFVLTVTNIVKPINNYTIPPLLSNYFIVDAWNTDVTSKTNNLSMNQAQDDLRFRNTAITSLADWKTWLSTHNTEVIYQLAEPTLLPCTAEQIEQLEALKDMQLYDSYTNITSLDVIQPNLNFHYNFVTPAPSPDRESPIYSVADNNSINITVSNEDETEVQSFTITTQQPFRKIGDVFDDFVKTGDTWYERHKIGRVLFNGTENFEIHNSNVRRTAIKTSLISNMEDYTSPNDIPNLVSNYFLPMSENDTWIPNYIARMTSSNALYFLLEPNTSVADFKTWLSTHNTEVIYVLAEPTLTPCTAAQTEQLEALQNILLTQTPVIINSNDATFPRLKLTYYTKDDIKYITVQTDRIIGFVDNIEAVKQAIYHILMTERYANLIYDENYGIELEQYIGADLEYIQTTIEQTLREALTHDLRILDVKVTSVENIEKDLVLVKFNAYTIYGNLNMEVNINV